jgi:hypothetical protein
MTVADLIEDLKSFPPDAKVELGKLMAADFVGKGEPTDETEMYEMVLDFPIIGIAYNPENKDFRFVVEYIEGVEKYAKTLGTFTKLSGNTVTEKNLN